MSKRENRFTLKGEVVQRHEAEEKLRGPGSAVLVRRGVLRSIVIACPDGCGESLTINLDARAGPAWRFYRTGSGISLFPSVWRDSGCRSHFIVWDSRIYWCDLYDELDMPMENVILRVKDALPDHFINYVDLSDQLDLIPWAVLSACNRLCQLGFALRGPDANKGEFKRAARKS